MEVLGLSSPVATSAAAYMQRNAELGRSTSSVEKAEDTGIKAAASIERLSLDLSIDHSITPVNATIESVLETRTPVETLERRFETGSAGVPENETYEFPEELPMNFLEMIDMWRVEKPVNANGAAGYDGYSPTDPASAAEGQRVNRTV